MTPTFETVYIRPGMPRKVLCVGGAGYVGAVLVPMLLERGHEVRVLDLYLYGKEALESVRGNPNLDEVTGDLRDIDLVRRSLEGCDAVIHLACISNDPSFELDPALGKSINYDPFAPTLAACKDAGVDRFVFASSSSVYGISDDPDVDEDHPLNPLTDYSKYKAMCEELLFSEQADDFTTVALRPATICGYSPRQRLDLTVNILTSHAYNNDKITVFGGEQERPNLHMLDCCDFYVQLLELPAERVAGKVYNAGYENHTVRDIAEIVRGVVARKRGLEPGAIDIVTTPTDDIRSYHISARRIERELGLTYKRTIEDGAADLCDAFAAGRLPDPLTSVRYSNVKLMKQRGLT